MTCWQWKLVHSGILPVYVRKRAAKTLGCNFQCDAWYLHPNSTLNTRFKLRQ
jgi:hypothetical protein